MDVSEDKHDDPNLPIDFKNFNGHNRNIEFSMAIEELSIERDYFKSEFLRARERIREGKEELLRRIDGDRREKGCLEEEIYEGVREREELVRKIDVGMREKESLLKEIDFLKQRNEELQENMSKSSGVLGSIKDSLMRVNESLCEKLGSGFDHEHEHIEQEDIHFEDKSDDLFGSLESLSKIAKSVEDRLSHFEEIDTLMKENEAYKKRNDELDQSLSRNSELIGSIKASLIRVTEALDEKKDEILIDHESQQTEEDSNFQDASEQLDEANSFSTELVSISKMAKRVEERLNDFQNKVVREKRELERSVVSLTEENRDVNTLLRIALVEKEAVEKSLNKLKGNNEQKRPPLLQMAERGLHIVSFGFMMGGGGGTNEQTEQQKKDIEQVSENNVSTASNASDVSSECEEEVISLVSTVEKMMRNLRLEITQLRKALEESRSDSERLQCLTEKQAQQIREQSFYIKELEYQESLLSQNVEELVVKVKATEEEVERWREACELEVEAGKRALEERDKLMEILKRELEKTRASLASSKSKLKLKEELAEAAMAAQSTAERSLNLADNRATMLQQRIEELTRQLEEVESRERNRRKIRRICCPWLALKVANPARRVLPEMQALLHHRD